MPLQRDKAKPFHARRNFRPHPRVTPKAIVRERIDTVRKKGIYLLPNLFTLSSLFSGFYAVIIAMAGDFEKAAIAIFVSMILDGCDGRVARLTLLRALSAFSSIPWPTCVLSVWRRQWWSTSGLSMI